MLGTHKQVGNIDGSGTTQDNAGSDLTANHIIQSALVIGATAGSHCLVTIDASDSSGGPLGQLGTDGSELGAGGLSSAAFGGAADSAGSLPLGAEGFSGDPIPVPALFRVVAGLGGAAVAARPA